MRVLEQLGRFSAFGIRQAAIGNTLNAAAEFGRRPVPARRGLRDAGAGDVRDVLARRDRRGRGGVAAEEDAVQGLEARPWISLSWSGGFRVMVICLL